MGPRPFPETDSSLRVPSRPTAAPQVGKDHHRPLHLFHPPRRADLSGPPRQDCSGTPFRRRWAVLSGELSVQFGNLAARGMRDVQVIEERPTPLADFSGRTSVSGVLKCPACIRKMLHLGLQTNKLPLLDVSNEHPGPHTKWNFVYSDPFVQQTLPIWTAAFILLIFHWTPEGLALSPCSEDD